MRYAEKFARCFGIGSLPLAPGSWASLVALPFAYLSHAVAGMAGIMLLTGLAVALGFWSLSQLATARDDPPEVVIDEFVGQLVACWPAAWVMQAEGASGAVQVACWGAAFVGFRVFDILKPWPIGRIDRQKGPGWVMLDDLVAGLAAGIGVVVLAWLLDVHLLAS